MPEVFRIPVDWLLLPLPLMAAVASTSVQGRSFTTPSNTDGVVMQNAELNKVVDDAENDNPTLIPLTNAEALDQLHDAAYDHLVAKTPWHKRNILLRAKAGELGLSLISKDLIASGGVLVAPSLGQIGWLIGQLQIRRRARKQGQRQGRMAVGGQAIRHAADPGIHTEHLRQHDIDTIY